jgi:hypothetical protein
MSKGPWLNYMQVIRFSTTMGKPGHQKLRRSWVHLLTGQLFATSLSKALKSRLPAPFSQLWRLFKYSSKDILGLTNAVLTWEVSGLQRSNWMEMTNLGLKFDVITLSVNYRARNSWQHPRHLLWCPSQLPWCHAYFLVLQGKSFFSIFSLKCALFAVLSFLPLDKLIRSLNKIHKIGYCPFNWARFGWMITLPKLKPTIKVVVCVVTEFHSWTLQHVIKSMDLDCGI